MNRDAERSLSDRFRIIEVDIERRSVLGRDTKIVLSVRQGDSSSVVQLCHDRVRVEGADTQIGGGSTPVLPDHQGCP